MGLGTQYDWSTQGYAHSLSWIYLPSPAMIHHSLLAWEGKLDQIFSPLQFAFIRKKTSFKTCLLMAAHVKDPQALRNQAIG